MRADLDRAFDGSGGCSARGENRLVTGQLPDLEVGRRADLDRAAVGVDRGDVARPAVRARAGDAQTLALADGETVHAVMGGQHGPALVDHRAAPHPDALAQEGPGVAGWNEADVVAVRLARDRQSPPRRLFADLRLGGVPDRECGMP